MTIESGEDCWSDSRQAYRTTGWSSLTGRKERASAGHETGARFSLARRLRTGMLASAPAARGKLRIRILREYCRTDRR